MAELPKLVLERPDTARNGNKNGPRRSASLHVRYEKKREHSKCGSYDLIMIATGTTRFADVAASAWMLSTASFPVQPSHIEQAKKQLRTPALPISLPRSPNADVFAEFEEGRRISCGVAVG